MENMSEFNNERREFIRVTDRISVTLSMLDIDEEAELIAMLGTQNYSSNSQRLDALQIELDHCIEQVKDVSQSAARAIELLNEKIDILSQSIRKKLEPSHHYINASISSGGMALLNAEHYPVGRYLETQIEFESSDDTIQAIARVISCEQRADAAKDTPYFLRLAFSHISEMDRNTLVKYTAP